MEHCQDGEQGGKRPEDGMSLASWDETGTLVLGHMELRGKWLVLEVNSAARAERGKQMLMQLLGGLVAMPVTETQSVQSALEEHRARTRSSAEEAAPKLPPQAAARVMRELPSSPPVVNGARATRRLILRLPKRGSPIHSASPCPALSRRSERPTLRSGCRPLPARFEQRSRPW